MITNECLDEIKGGERPTMSEEVDVERRKAGAFTRAAGLMTNSSTVSSRVWSFKISCSTLRSRGKCMGAQKRILEMICVERIAP